MSSPVFTRLVPFCSPSKQSPLKISPINFMPSYMLRKARNLISPSRFPFPWSKNPEDVVNQKVTSQTPEKEKPEADWPPSVPLPVPRAATRCRCWQPGPHCWAVCPLQEDAHTVQSLHRTQPSSSTLQLLGSSSFHLHANIPTFHLFPSRASGSYLTDLSWRHPNLLLV